MTTNECSVAKKWKNSFCRFFTDAAEMCSCVFWPYTRQQQRANNSPASMLLYSLWDCDGKRNTDDVPYGHTALFISIIKLWTQTLFLLHARSHKLACLLSGKKKKRLHNVLNAVIISFRAPRSMFNIFSWRPTKTACFDAVVVDDDDDHFSL